jgi:Tfp pilus assembly protein FimT
MQKTKRGGYTILELSLVIGFVVIIGSFVVLNFSGRKSKTDLNSSAQKISALLREAQSKSAAQSSSTTWGVHFDNTSTSSPFFALFKTNTYGTSTRSGLNPLPSGVAFTTSTVPEGSVKEIVFAQLTGFVPASTSVGIYARNDTDSAITIQISTSGSVTF